MIKSMTDEVRGKVRAKLAERGESYSDVADALGTSKNQISRMIGANRKKHIGELTDIWTQLFEYVGLELCVKEVKQ